jgi:DNA helicase-2/ATP-dependent DNA helicase PcrA
MDKKIILAVAGSGKTTLIVGKLNLEKRFLILTYTINNTRNIRESIISKFGLFPNNVVLQSYYVFLYNFCVKPFIAYELRPKGIRWEAPPKWTDRTRLDELSRYVTKDKRLYSNRISKLLEVREVLPEINARLEKYYDCLLVDEVQDFAGHDFNLLTNMVKSKIEVCLVGDFFQHTFDTSRDGRTNYSLHSDYLKYQERFRKNKIRVDAEYLNKSWRCSPTICSFISNKIGIPIESHRNEEVIIKYIDNEEEAEVIFKNNSIVKLFYQESNKYDCYSKNWGDCKGENCYDDICVVLNKKSMEHYEKGILQAMPSVSKNKLYVACSRAKGNLYFLSEKMIKKYKK